MKPLRLVKHDRVQWNDHFKLPEVNIAYQNFIILPASEPQLYRPNVNEVVL